MLKRWKRLVAAVALIVVSGVVGFGALRAGSGGAKLYYVPVKLETLYAITPANIEDAAYDVIQPDESDAKLRQVRALLARLEPGSVNDQITRLKVRYADGAIVLADKDGGVRRSDKTGTLSKSNFAELERVLSALAPHDFE